MANYNRQNTKNVEIIQMNVMATTSIILLLDQVTWH